MSEFLRGILARLQSEFQPDVLGASVASFLANIVVGILVFSAFYLLWWLLDRAMGLALRRSRLDRTTANFLETLLKYSILAVGAVQALDATGVNTATLVASLGIAGLTVGFAARDALSNLISGLLIFWDRPFVIGDLVEVEGHYGRVDKITLRSTRVVTTDGRMLAVPNSAVINTTVASYTNFPHLRLDVPVTIAVTEDIERARRVLLELVTADEAFLGDPPARVVVTQLNDYNVTLELQVWLGDERQHIPRRFALREQMFAALTRAGVVMPFETLQLAPLDVRLTPVPA